MEVAENFPDESRHVLQNLASVYHNDALAREQKLSPEDRLRFHQERSGPIMQELQQWIKAQIAEHRVEPNSGLGKAFSYLLKHGKKLPFFFRNQEPRWITISSLPLAAVRMICRVPDYAALQESVTWFSRRISDV